MMLVIDATAIRATKKTTDVVRFNKAAMTNTGGLELLNRCATLVLEHAHRRFDC
jgi:hypothetical protein